MKKIIYLVIPFLISCNCASAQSTLTPQLIKGNYKLPDNTFVQVVYRNGKYVPYNDAGDYQVGDIQHSYVTQIFELSFWNVGSQSPNKDHAKAVLEITTRSTKPGSIIIAPSVYEEHPRLGPRWKIYSEGESRPPDQVDKIEFNFSGGIDGVFTPTGNTEILSNKIKGGKIVKSEDNDLAAVIEYENGGVIPMSITKYLSNFLEETIDSTMVINGMTGNVEILLPGKGPRGWQSAWKSYKDKVSLPVGTRIRTKDDSSVALLIPDAVSTNVISTTILDQNSEVIITYDPKKNITGFLEKLKIAHGQAIVNMKRIFTEGSMEIEMNQAVAGIKGTTLVLEDDGQTSTLKVIEGVVNFKSKTTGESKDISAGQMIEANQAGLGNSSDFDIAAENAKWDKIDQKIQKSAEETEEPVLSADWANKYWYLLLILIIPLGIFIWRYLKKIKK